MPTSIDHILKNSHFFILFDIGKKWVYLHKTLKAIFCLHLHFLFLYLGCLKDSADFNPIELSLNYLKLNQVFSFIYGLNFFLSILRGIWQRSILLEILDPATFCFTTLGIGRLQKLLNYTNVIIHIAISN